LQNASADVERSEAETFRRLDLAALRTQNQERTLMSTTGATGATVLYMSVSLDGFIAGPNEGPGNGLGDGGERLHEWVLTGDSGGASGPPGIVSRGINGQIAEEFMATGAVVAGRGTFEPAGGWGGDHHDGVPIFILSRREPGIDISAWPLVTYLDDVESAMSHAREAAGDRNVLVHGAAVAQLALAAGVLDELELHVVPILLCRGRPLFGDIVPTAVELERVRVLEGEDGVTHMRYRVLSSASGVAQPPR
jgi:dihydrofolate reductase